VVGMNNILSLCIKLILRRTLKYTRAINLMIKKTIFSILIIYILALLTPLDSLFNKSTYADNKGNEISVGLSNRDNLQFSEEEKQWIKNHPVVRARIGAAPPLHFFEGSPKGISVDYLNLIAERVGFQVKYITEIPWSKAIDSIKNHEEIDLILTAKITEERKKFISFTDNYLIIPLVIFTRNEIGFISGIDDLKHKTVSVERGYVLHRQLIDQFPEIELLVVETSREAIEAVAIGKADAYIGNLTITTYIIRQNNLNNVKIAAPTPFENHNQAMAIRDDWPQLTSIINKSFKSLTPEEHIAIKNRWMKVRYEYGITKSDFVKWILVFGVFSIIIIGIIMFWNWRLKKEIIQREESEKTLLENEAFIKAVMDNLPMGIAVNSVDPTVNFNYMNDNFPKYYRTTRQKLADPDMFWESVYEDPIFREEIKNKILNDCASDDPKNMYWTDVPITRKGNETSYISARNIPIPYKQLMISTVWDVTNRKQAEKALREANTRHSAMIANIGDVIGIMGADGIMKYKSPNIEKWFGWKPKDLIGADGLKTVYPEDLERIQKEFSALLERENASTTVEYRYKCKDGTYTWIELVAVNCINDTTINGILLNYHDITKRKQSEDALEKRMIALTRPLDNPEGIAFEEIFNLDDIQHLQNQFAEATGVASIITHTDGKPITKASNFCRLCNDIIRKTDKGLINCFKSDAILGQYNPDGPIIKACHSGGLWDAGAAISIGGKHIANWLIGQVRDETQSEEKMRSYAREIGAEEEIVVEAFREVPSMSREQFDQVAQTLFTLAKQISTTAYQNIQQARFISELRQSKEEQSRLQAQLNQAQKMESIGTLAGGIAHDFNNILFPILGHSEMLLEDVPKDSPFQPGLKQIYTGAMRASELVKQILTFSRQETGELKLMKMQPIIKEALKLIRSTIPTTIEIKQDVSPACGAINADPTQIHQIVMNLATNAYHAMEETGGELKVSLNELELSPLDLINPDMTPGQYACLTVTDTGTGVDKKLTQKIFDPFFTTKAVGKGTGMGLSVVHGIVAGMGGAVRVYSEPDKGTQFYVYFPVEKSSFEKQSVQTHETIQGGTETILLVDDEDAIITMEKRMLERLGYQVTSRTSSIEALEAFRGSPDKFDLVITDMAMPDMPGDNLSVELTKVRPDIPVLLCTGFSETMSEEKAASLGIKGFLLKPIIIKDLAQKIREVLESNKTKNTN